MSSFQNAWPIKIKAVYTLVLFHIIHSFPWLALITTCVFFKTTYFILLNLQLVAGGKKYCSAGKFYWLLPDKETTTNPKSLWVNNVKMTPLQVEKKELYKNNGENTLLGAGVDSLIQHLSCASNIKRLWLDYVKMTPQKVMGAGISSIIQHLSCAPNVKRL